jgi:predicted cation transporter
MGQVKMIIELLVIFILVLVLPLTVRMVERNLELFLFVMGLLAAVVSGVLSSTLFIRAASDPIKITVAVFVAGVLFKWFQVPLEKMITRFSKTIPFRMFIAVTVILIGLISSLITAIIAALVLVVVVTALKLDRISEIRFVVLTCFSIGLGAALTPIGEPLSTIAISKLDKDFFYLMRLIGSEVLIALVILGTFAALLVRGPKHGERLSRKETSSESYEEILVRALKIYFFIMGLTFLGGAFEPVINLYFLGVAPSLLYWINIISAILDNATLASAEISPIMDNFTIRSILLGLLISGGMLIPGNIPNIIAAGKLRITSKEWALVGVPLGLLIMIAYFYLVFILEK